MKAKACMAILVASLAASSSFATEFRAFTRAAQVAGSDLVLVGRVESVRSAWGVDRSAIYTDAEIAIEEVWKGMPAGDRITVRTLGGTVDGIRLEVEGAARFVAGEEVLVLLDETGGVYTPRGMRFGKYGIVGAGDRRLAIGSPPPTVNGAQSSRETSVSLNDLRAEVTSALVKETR